MEAISSAVRNSSSSLSVSFSSIVRASYSGNPIGVPVSSSASIYTKFKHITGIPSGKGERSVSVNRLKQLDIIIDQLRKMYNQEMSVDYNEVEGNKIEDLIMELSAKLRNSLNSNGAEYFSGIYEPGSILNLTA